MLQGAKFWLLDDGLNKICRHLLLADGQWPGLMFMVTWTPWLGATSLVVGLVGATAAMTMRIIPKGHGGHAIPADRGQWQPHAKELQGSNYAPIEAYDSLPTSTSYAPYVGFST